MVTWAWFAIVISVYSMVLTDRNFFRSSDGIQGFMGWLLAISMAVSAAGSFRRERESGVLELLLVSPLSVRQIIGGRLRGLWGQFLLSIATLLGIWAYFLTIFPRSYSYGSEGMAAVWFFAVSFLVIPVIGLYFSVCSRHFVGALVLTLGFAFVMPEFFSTTVRLLQSLLTPGGRHFDWSENPVSSVCFFQLIIAGYLLSRLYYKLEHRSFPLERSLA
jgi:ABC-type transport system involved in multi-copper enzyme maturation permease subunit